MKTFEFIKDLCIMAICSILALGIYSCTPEDPSNIYGRNKEMQIVDENNNEIEMTYATMLGGGGFCITGGKGKNHSVEVVDEDILTATYCQKGVVQPEKRTMPASVFIQPKKIGETTIIVTDTDTDEMKMIKVKVVYNYQTLTIGDSSAEGLMNGMQICFMNEGEEGDNEYRIVIQSDNKYISYEEGDYHFEIPETDRSYFFLTFKNDEMETIWKVTDADNNSEGLDNYVPNVIKGIRLHDHVLTKLTPSWAYPQIFLFTDTANPDRHFKTGPAKSISYRFE